jgi:hypothetical protein
MPNLSEIRERLNRVQATWVPNPDANPIEQFQAGIAALFAGAGITEEATLRALNVLRESGPYVGQLVREHSFLRGEDAALTIRTLFGDGDPTWDEVRAYYTRNSLLYITSLILAAPDLGDRTLDLVLRIGFGLDEENAFFRGRLFGPFGGLLELLKLGVPLPPRRDPLRDILNSTCMLGVSHALNHFGRTVQRDVLHLGDLKRRTKNPLLVKCPVHGHGSDSAESWIG